MWKHIPDMAERGELEPQKSANYRARYKNTVRGIINDMFEDGELIKIADGHYRLP